MEEKNILELSENEVLDKYNDIVEGGQQVLIAKCIYGCYCGALGGKECVVCGYCYD